MSFTSPFLGVFQGLLNNGQVASYGSLHIYDFYTGEECDTWTTSFQHTLNPKPVILSGSGKAEVFLDRNKTYNITLKDRYNVVVWTMEEYQVPCGECDCSDGDGVCYTFKVSDGLGGYVEYIVAGDNFMVGDVHGGCGQWEKDEDCIPIPPTPPEYGQDCEEGECPDCIQFNVSANSGEFEKFVPDGSDAFMTSAIHGICGTFGASFLIEIESVGEPSFIVQDGDVTVMSIGDGWWRAYSEDPITRIEFALNTVSQAVTKVICINSTSALESMLTMFSPSGYKMDALTSIVFENGFDTSNVTTLVGAFEHLSALTTLDVVDMDVSSVTTMENTFANISNITTVDTTGWVTTALLNASEAFYASGYTSIDISHWDMSNVSTTESMFNQCVNITSILLPNNIDIVGSIGGMFWNCPELLHMDLSGITFDLVTNTGSLFKGCSKLDCITNVDTTNTPTPLSREMMFDGCTVITQPDSTDQALIIGTGGYDWTNAGSCP